MFSYAVVFPVTREIKKIRYNLPLYIHSFNEQTASLQTFHVDKSDTRMLPASHQQDSLESETSIEAKLSKILSLWLVSAVIYLHNLSFSTRHKSYFILRANYNQVLNDIDCWFPFDKGTIYPKILVFVSALNILIF